MHLNPRDPSHHVDPIFHRLWREISARLLRDIEHDRRMFPKREITIDQHRRLHIGIDRREFGVLVLSFDQIDADALNGGTDMIDKRKNANIAGSR